MPFIDAADLHVDYRDLGDADAPPVLLIHGWPDDATTWDRVAEALADRFRLLVPTLRGFGETRFRSDTAPRTGNSAMLAMDMIAFLDALGIERVSVVGHDWGSNTGEAMAVGWPDRVERLCQMSTPPRLGGMPTPPFWHAQLQWYHWFMATDRGAEAVRADPHGFAHIMWSNWAPPGWFDEATFRAVARSFDNPDWVAVTLHSYRARWNQAEPDPRSAWLEDKVKATATLSLPALYFQGAVDGVNPPAASAQVPSKFTGPFDYVELPDVGHFPQREAPDRVTGLLRPFLSGMRPAAS
jgi:pimeloyl-ACP methyl ester carboxylesterase